jgi:hypothetical protein
VVTGPISILLRIISRGVNQLPRSAKSEGPYNAWYNLKPRLMSHLFIASHECLLETLFMKLSLLLQKFSEERLKL